MRRSGDRGAPAYNTSKHIFYAADRFADVLHQQAVEEAWLGPVTETEADSEQPVVASASSPDDVREAALDGGVRASSPWQSHGHNCPHSYQSQGHAGREGLSYGEGWG